MGVVAGVVGIDPVERCEFSYCQGLLADEVLVIIEVEMRVGRHYDVVSRRGCLLPSGGAAPTHHHCVLRYSGLQDFVPAYGNAAMVFKPAGNVAHEVALQLVHVGKTLLLHTPAAVYACGPVFHHGLIAPDVHVFAGEDIYDLGKDVFQQAYSAVVARAEVPAEIATAAALVYAGKLRIGAVDLHAVAGHLYFRDDLDVAFCGVGDYLPQVFLSVVAAVRIGRICCGEWVSARFPLGVCVADAPCGPFRELGVRFDFYAPAGGVREVKVQAVEPQERHCVYLLLEEFLALEAARLVNHQAAVPVAGIVEDGAASACRV